jgi:hypothetical protein
MFKVIFLYINAFIQSKCHSNINERQIFVPKFVKSTNKMAKQDKFYAKIFEIHSAYIIYSLIVTERQFK